MRKIITILFLVLGVVLTFGLTGCNEQQVTNDNTPVVWTPIDDEILNDQWNQEGEIQYKFPNAFQCTLQIAGSKYIITRLTKVGSIGELSWAWQDNGNIIIKYFDIKYGFQNPFPLSNEEFEGYVEIGDDSIMVWLGGVPVIKDKAFLKDNPKYNKAYKKK
jgi:hypothetical protein